MLTVDADKLLICNSFHNFDPNNEYANIIQIKMTIIHFIMWIQDNDAWIDRHMGGQRGWIWYNCNNQI